MATTFNDLPFVDISVHIFKNLPLVDLFRCRRVCKLFKERVEKFKISQIVLSCVNYYTGNWFQTGDLICYDEPIDLSKFLSILQRSNLENTLKRLHIGYFAGYNGNVDELFNKFKLIEILEFERELPYYEINLQNLKFLRLPFCEHTKKLNTPKLESIKGYKLLDTVSFIYPETIKSIEDNNSSYGNVNKLINLESITFWFGISEEALNDLFNLNKLKSITQNLHYSRSVLKRKTELGKSDLKIYCYGVLIEDVGKLEEYESNISLFEFQCNNYDLLADNYLSDETIDYDHVFNSWPRIKSIPKCFFKKFIRRDQLLIKSKISNYEHFEFFF